MLRIIPVLFLLLLMLAGRALAQDDLPVFADVRENGWKDYSWATVGTSTTTVHGGTTSLSVACQGYGALSLAHAPFNPQLYQSLSFWINGGSAGGQNLIVQGELNYVPKTKVTIPTLAANTWTHVTIPLADLGVATDGTFNGFWIQNTSANSVSTFYVDDISLVGATLPSSVQIAVNAGTTLRTIDERIYGLNLAMWDSHLNSTASTDALTAMQTRVVRFPGGSNSDDYDWQLDRSVDNNTFQWANSAATFAKIAAAQGTQAFVTVNYGSGTPEQAAAWVAYYNGSPSDNTALGTDSKGRDWKTVGYWAGLRAAAPLSTDDGYNFLRASHMAAYGFKDWEVGNECYGNWEYDTHGVSGSGLSGSKYDAVTYANAFASFYQKMLAVDSTIHIGAVATVGEDSYPGTTSVTNPNETTNATHSGWTPVLLTTLKSLGVTPHFLIHHRYPQNPSFNGNPADGDECDATLLQSPTGIASDATDLRKQITDYVGPGNGAGIELTMTEMNSVSSQPGKQSTSLVNGLYFADALGALAETEYRACMWWAFRNGAVTNANNSDWLYGWRTFGDYGVVADGSRSDTPANTPYPSYYAAKLLGNWGRGGDAVLSATSSSSALSAHAALLANGRLALLVVNKSPSTDLTAQINLTGFVPGSTTAQLWQYGKSNDTAGGDLTTGTVVNVSNNFTATFPAYSMTVLQFAAQVTFDIWRAAHFTTSELNDPTISGPAADPDHDGLSNLLEYALGTDPKTRNDSAAPTVAHTQVSGKNYLTLVFTKLTTLSDVAYDVQVSNDLVTWHSGSSYVVRMDDGTTTSAIFRDLTAIEDLPQQWMRLVVTRP